MVSNQTAERLDTEATTKNLPKANEILATRGDKLVLHKRQYFSKSFQRKNSTNRPTETSATARLITRYKLRLRSLGSLR